MQPQFIRGPAQPVWIAGQLWQAARDGRYICAFVDDYVTNPVNQVITSVDLVYNLQPNDLLLVMCVMYGSITDNQGCRFKLVACSDVDGGGVVTDLMPWFAFYNGATRIGFTTQKVDMPIIPIRWSQGVRSVTMRIASTNVAVAVSCGYAATREREV